MCCLCLAFALAFLVVIPEGDLRFAVGCLISKNQTASDIKALKARNTLA
jgi:hypothetical protein